VTPAVGLAALVFITLVWGTSFAIVKEALDHIPVPLLLAVRFSLAAACFAWVRFDRRAVVPALWLGLVGFAGFATQTIGLELTSASNAAFITGLAVVLTPMLAAVVWRRRVAPRVYRGRRVAVAGLALLTIGEGGVAGLNAGDVWVLGTALTYAVYVVYLGEVAGRASVFALAGMQHLPMALLAWAWAWPSARRWPRYRSSRSARSPTWPWCRRRSWPCCRRWRSAWWRRRWRRWCSCSSPCSPPSSPPGGSASGWARSAGWAEAWSSWRWW
jgi:drug/metabolite transporter (DMT)-like permease